MRNSKSIYLITDRFDSSSRIMFSEVIQSFEELPGLENHLYYIDLRRRVFDDVIQESEINPRFSLLKDCYEMNY